MGVLFSPGKLLLTSEYVVLDGALALAVPTKWGQELHFTQTLDSKHLVHWEAYHQESLWLCCTINYLNWEVIETNDIKASSFVVKVLKLVQQYSARVLKGTDSYHLKTTLQFPADYGLGSSSTLLNNLANWAAIDPYRLNEEALGGSGYDIAVAQEKKPLLYQNRESERVVLIKDLDFAFKNELLFIHLNRKQNSREGIKLYRDKPISVNLVSEFTNITKSVLGAQTLKAFCDLMQRHENLLSAHLGLNTAKQLYFSDAPVFVKSLGAWGGDFVMSCKFEGYQSYFQSKGFNTIFEWSDIIG